MHAQFENLGLPWEASFFSFFFMYGGSAISYEFGKPMKAMFWCMASVVAHFADLGHALESRFCCYTWCLAHPPLGSALGEMDVKA